MQCKSMGSTQGATEAFMGLSRIRAMHGKCQRDCVAMPPQGLAVLELGPALAALQ